MCPVFLEPKTTLYKIDSKGKIREWTIELDGNKYRTTYGEKDGEKTTTEWTVCKSKNVGRANQTSPEQQAYSEVEAIIKKQQEKGYGKTAVKVFGNPMLAKSYDDYKDKIVFPVYSQPKLDGIRCIVSATGMRTRNGKDIVAAPHIFESLKSILGNQIGAAFDGELYNHDLKHNFNKICSLVKKLKPSKEELQESKDTVQFWIYDWTDRKMKFKDRTRFLSNTVTESNSIKLVPTQEIRNKSELDSYYEQYIKDGYEGQMVRLDEIYEEKRSRFLLKRKEFMDAEFEIVDIEPGVGNRAKMAGFMRLMDEDGREFKSNIKANWEELTEYLDNKDEYIGKLATVKFFNYTPDKIPRFPYVLRVREDFDI